MRLSFFLKTAEQKTPKSPKGKNTCSAICLKLAQTLAALLRRKQFVSIRPPSRQRYGVFCPLAAAVPGLVTELLGRGTCVSGEPAGVAGTMESPFSPGLPYRPDEDWGEWDLRLCQGWLQVSSSLLPRPLGDRCGRILSGKRGSLSASVRGPSRV